MGEIKVSSHNLGWLLADSTDTPGPLLPGRLLRARRIPPGPAGHGDRGAAPPGGGRGATRVHGRGPGRARGDPDRRVVRTADPCHLGRRRRAWPGLVGTSGRRAKGAGTGTTAPNAAPFRAPGRERHVRAANVRSLSVHHGTAPQPRRGQSARRGVPGRTYPPVSQCAAAAPDRPVVQFLPPDTPSTLCRGCSRVRLTLRGGLSMPSPCRLGARSPRRGLAARRQLCRTSEVTRACLGGPLCRQSVAGMGVEIRGDCSRVFFVPSAATATMTYHLSGEASRGHLIEVASPGTLYLLRE